MTINKDAPARYRYVRRRWIVLMTVIDAVGGFFVRCFGMFRRRTDKNDKTENIVPGRILLIQLDHLGDALLTSATLEPIRSRWPSASIEVLCGPAGREVFELSPYVDHVHVSRTNRFSRGLIRRRLWPFALIYWAAKFRQRRFDLAVDVRGELPHALLMRLAGARKRVGWNAGGGGFMLTDSPAYVPERPELESRSALLECMGIDVAADNLRPQLPIDCQVGRLLDRQIDGETGIRHDDNPTAKKLPAGPRIAIHPGAGTEAKRWPRQYWLDLMVRILRRYDRATIILVGGRDDRPHGEFILDATRQLADAGDIPADRVVDRTGRLTLARSAALIARCDLLVGADSGPAHLAAAVGTPTLVLFSGTNVVEQWRPPGKYVSTLAADVPCRSCRATLCPHVDHPCMRGIFPAEVVASLEEMLQMSNEDMIPTEKERVAAAHRY